MLKGQEDWTESVNDRSKIDLDISCHKEKYVYALARDLSKLQRGSHNVDTPLVYIAYLW